jgi:hypothetical protein
VTIVLNEDEAPTFALELTLDELRVVAKSISKTRDAELKKLGRLKPGTHVHNEVQADYRLIDRVDAEVGNAINELVKGL